MRLLTLLGAGMLFVGSANGALLWLDSGGQGSVDLAPGESADIKIMLTIREIDPGWAHAIVALNDDDQLTNGEIDVTELAPIGDPGPFYDRSGFTLPADVSWDVGNEYYLIMGATYEGGGNLGGDGTEVTFVLDTLTVTHNGSSTEGTVPITFSSSSSLSSSDERPNRSRNKGELCCPSVGAGSCRLPSWEARFQMGPLMG